MKWFRQDFSQQIPAQAISLRTSLGPSPSADSALGLLPTIYNKSREALSWRSQSQFLLRNRGPSCANDDISFSALNLSPTWLGNVECIPVMDFQYLVLLPWGTFVEVWGGEERAGHAPLQLHIPVIKVSKTWVVSPLLAPVQLYSCWCWAALGGFRSWLQKIRSCCFKKSPSRCSVTLRGDPASLWWHFQKGTTWWLSLSQYHACVLRHHIQDHIQARLPSGPFFNRFWSFGQTKQKWHPSVRHRNTKFEEMVAISHLLEI